MKLTTKRAAGCLMLAGTALLAVTAPLPASAAVADGPLSVTIEPLPQTLGNNLTAVAAVPGGTAWAVGQSSAGAFVLHWDGTAWTQVADAPSTSDLTSVAAASPDAVWAVSDQATVLGWDGTAWSRTFPQFESGIPVLAGVAAISPAQA